MIPYFEVHGRQDSSAPTVLMCSGLGGLAHYWEQQIPVFGRERRVIVYDQSGAGRSPGSLPHDHDIDAMAADAFAVIDAAEATRVDVVGHALGGLIGLAMAHARPQSIGKLVLVNAWAAFHPHTGRCFDTRLGLLLKGGWPYYVRAQPLFLYPAWWMARNPTLIADEEQRTLRSPPRIEDLLHRIKALRAFDATSWLDTIEAPSLAVAAEDDLLVPFDCSTDLSRRLKRCDLTLFPKGGHAVNVTAPDDFNSTVLRFLDA